MKTVSIFSFEDLPKSKQDEILDKCFTDRLRELVECGNIIPELKDNYDNAVNKAERLQTPWFMGEILLEDSKIKEHLKELALFDANYCMYVESNYQEGKNTSIHPLVLI